MNLDGSRGANEEGRAATKGNSTLKMGDGTAKLVRNPSKKKTTKKKNKGIGRRKSVENFDDNDDRNEDECPPTKAIKEKAVAKKTNERRNSKRTSARKSSDQKRKTPGRRQFIECQDDNDGVGDEENPVRHSALKKNVPKENMVNDYGIRTAAAKRTEPDQRPGKQAALGFGCEDEGTIYDSDSSTKESNDDMSRQLVSDGHGRWSISQEVPVGRSIFQEETSSENDTFSENDSSSDSGSARYQMTKPVPRYETNSDYCDDYEVTGSSDDASRPNQATEFKFQNTNIKDSKEKDSGVDSSSEADTYSAAMTSMKETSLQHSTAKMRDSVPAIHPSSEEWSRPYVSQYEVNDRWMLSVKREEGEDIGLGLVFYRNELFIVEVEVGPFYNTALDKGDKILKINGKKIPEDITSVTDAEELMESKTKITLFVTRPHPHHDDGYQWIMKRF